VSVAYQVLLCTFALFFHSTMRRFSIRSRQQVKFVTGWVAFGPVPSNSRVAVLLFTDTTSSPPLIAWTKHTGLSENRNIMLLWYIICMPSTLGRVLHHDCYILVALTFSDMNTPVSSVQLSFLHKSSPIF